MDGQRPRIWNPNEVFDISSADRKALQERAKMRADLKLEWQKKVTNPYRGVGGTIFDPAVQRFLSMRATHWDQFKATPKNAMFTLGVVVFPILAIWYKITKDKATLEKQCRTGQISYADRPWKFV